MNSSLKFEKIKHCCAKTPSIKWNSSNIEPGAGNLFVKFNSSLVRFMTVNFVSVAMPRIPAESASEDVQHFNSAWLKICLSTLFSSLSPRIKCPPRDWRHRQVGDVSSLREARIAV